MKKILFILLLFSAGFVSAQQITYTPMTAAGYQFKYGKFDSLIHIPFGDTSISRGSSRPGALMCFTGDSLIYRWDGLRWHVIAPATANTVYYAVDSLTYDTNLLCWWKQGIATCYTIIGGGGVDSVTLVDDQLCQWKGGVSTCYSIIDGVLGVFVDSVVVSGNQLCQWKAGISTCYTINNTNNGIDSVTFVGTQLCQWKGGVATCYTIPGAISGSFIDSVTLHGDTLCQWFEGSSICYDLGNYFSDVTNNYDTTGLKFYDFQGNLLDSVDLHYKLLFARSGVSLKDTTVTLNGKEREGVVIYGGGGSSGTSGTLQEAFDASILAGDNPTMSGHGNNDLLIDSLNDFKVYGKATFGTSTLFMQVDHDDGGQNITTQVRSSAGEAELQHFNSNTNQGTIIGARKDSIYFNNSFGVFHIDSVNTAASTTNKSVLIYDAVTDRMERISIDSVGGIGSVTNDAPQWIVTDSINTPVVSPSLNDSWLVGTSPTGDFVGHANEIAVWNGSSYDFSTATAGDFLYRSANGIVSKFNGTTWVRAEKLKIHNPSDSYGIPLSLGTGDAQTFSIRTNGSQRISISSGGTLTLVPLAGTGNGGIIKVSSTGVLSRLNPGSDGEVLTLASGLPVWAAPSGGGGGTITAVTGTSPIASSGGATPDISISNAAADGTTKGAASFTASDFDASSGNISLDYTNGQAASGSTKGYLTAADWTTFNNKGGLTDSGYYWQLTGNAPAFGSYLGTSTNRSLRFRVKNTQFMVADSATQNVGIGPSPVSGYKLSVDGAVYSSGGGGVSYWTPDGNAALRGTGAGSTNMYIDGNAGLGGTINLRSTTLNISGTTSGNVSTWTSVNSAPNLAISGYNLNNLNVFNIKVDSTMARFNDNTVIRKAAYKGANNLMSDTTVTVVEFPEPAMGALLELRSNSKGLLLPRMSKAGRDAIVKTGVSNGVVVAGTGYTSANYPAVALTGGTGTGATAKIRVSGGLVGTVSIVTAGTGYLVGDVLSSSSIGGGSGFTYTVTGLSCPAGMVIYQTDNTPGVRVWNGTNWMRYTETAD